MEIVKRKPSRPPPSPRPRATGRTRLAAGHTLFELLLLLTVLAIVAAVVLPRGPGTSERQVLERYAQTVYGALVEARAMAIARQAETRFAMEDDRSYRLEIRESSTGWSVVRRGSVDPERVTVTIDRSEEGAITFFPHGAVDVARTVSVRSSGRVVELEVLASGLVRWPSEQP